MGFTSVWSHVYLKRIPAVELIKKNWLIIINQLMDKVKIAGEIPAKYIIDEQIGEGINIENQMDDYCDVNVKYLFGFASDFLKAERLYCLFEEGCPEGLQEVTDKITLDNLDVDAPERNSIFIDDPDYIYFVYGLFGKTYPGSLRGGVRYGNIDNVRNFNFLLDIEFFKPYRVFHLNQFSNDVASFTLFSDEERSKCLQTFCNELPSEEQDKSTMENDCRCQ